MLNNIRQLAKLVFIFSILWILLGRNSTYVRTIINSCNLTTIFPDTADCPPSELSLRVTYKNNFDTLKCNIQSSDILHPPHEPIQFTAYSTNGGVFFAKIDEVAWIEFEKAEYYATLCLHKVGKDNCPGKDTCIRIENKIKEIAKNIEVCCKDYGKHNPNQHFIIWRNGIVNYFYVESITRSSKTILLDNVSDDASKKKKEMRIPDCRVETVIQTILGLGS